MSQLRSQCGMQFWSNAPGIEMNWRLQIPCPCYNRVPTLWYALKEPFILSLEPMAWSLSPQSRVRNVTENHDPVLTHLKLKGWFRSRETSHQAILKMALTSKPMEETEEGRAAGETFPSVWVLVPTPGSLFACTENSLFPPSIHMPWFPTPSPLHFHPVPFQSAW